MKFYEMFNNAQWITPDAECANPYIGMDFTLENVCNAIITVSGLGFYQLFLNNERVSDDHYIIGYILRVDRSISEKTAHFIEMLNSNI